MHVYISNETLYVVCRYIAIRDRLGLLFQPGPGPGSAKSAGTGTITAGPGL